MKIHQKKTLPSGVCLQAAEDAKLTEGETECLQEAQPISFGVLVDILSSGARLQNLQKKKKRL